MPAVPLYIDDLRDARHRSDRSISVGGYVRGLGRRGRSLIHRGLRLGVSDLRQTSVESSNCAGQSLDRDRKETSIPLAPFKLANILSVTLCLATNPRLPIIFVGMKRSTRILALILLAVFAAGMVANAADATAMALKMAFTDSGAMGDCERCGSDDGDKKSAASCDIVCVSPFSGTLNPEQAVHRRTAVTLSVFGLYDFVFRTEPPDPYPPRFLS